MWRWCWLLIWLLEVAFAQSDTIGGKETRLPPVFIEAERPLRVKRWRADSMGWPVPGSHLAQLLAQAEGVYLRAYGGQGSLQTVSVRGMGAPLTAVTVQGLPLRAPTLGLVNLAPFFLAGLREVTFSPGGNLTISPGAVGWVALDWRPQTHRNQIAWQVGSFGEISADFLAETPRSFLQAAALSVANQYRFSAPEVGQRERADYRYLQGSWAYRWGTWQLWGWGYMGVQEIPPPVVVGAFRGPHETLQHTQLSHTLTHTTSWAALRFQHHAERLQHTDALGYLGESRLHTLQGLWQRQVPFGDSLWQAEGSLYGAVDAVWSNRMAVGFRPLVRIVQGEGAAIAALQRSGQQAYVRAEGRITALTRFSPQVSGLLRAQWRAWGIELLRGVRYPSLWERYWVGYGKPDLPPERSLQAQLFTQTRWKGWGVYAAVFVAQTRNRIVTVPLSPVRWQAYSLGYVESQGAEGRISYTAARWQGWIGGTLMQVREYSFSRGALLPYTPPYIAQGGLLWRSGPWRLVYQGQYVSWRTYTLAQTAGAVLPGYALHGLLIQYSRAAYSLELGSENLLNSSYVVIQGYPMPPRRLYLRWQGRW